MDNTERLTLAVEKIAEQLDILCSLVALLVRASGTDVFEKNAAEPEVPNPVIKPSDIPTVMPECYRKYN